MEENRRVTARKRAYLWAGVTLATIVGAGALVFASVPHTFTNGETLTADNLNGNFSALDQRLTTLEALLPPGTIIAFGGPAGAATDGGAGGIPPGWLLCDGSAVSRATYASLFGAIGINFGGGDGITTFNLPDMRGRFLRGVDHGAGRDPDAANRAASASASLARRPQIMTSRTGRTLAWTRTRCGASAPVPIISSRAALCGAR